MVIKDPNNVTYDGRILSSSTTNLITFRDNDMLDVFNDWRRKNSQIEIVQMEITPVPASDQLLRGEIPTLNNLIILQIKDTGIDYSYPSGKGFLW